MGGWVDVARAPLDRWLARQAGVPDDERPRRPAIGWWAIAAALGAGAALPNGPRGAAIVLALAVAWTRPASGIGWWERRRRALFWVALAGAIELGGLRASSVDVAATPVEAAPLRSANVTLTEPLPASVPGSTAHGGQVRGTLGERRVVVAAARFGKPTPAFPRGATVRISGRVVPLAGTPSDLRLRRAGVAGRVLVREISWDGARRAGAIGAVDRFGDAAQAQLVTALGQRKGALVAGMALGIDEGIGEADRDALRRSGLWHLVAASGGNIALVVALVMALGWLVGMTDPWRVAASAAAIGAYVPLAGAGPSIQRAGVMGLVGLLAWRLGREHRAADALAVAAAATLAIDPRAWLDVGWQLSFAAAAGLIVAGPSVARRLSAGGVPRWLAAGLACTMIATVATAPIMLVTFGELSLIGLVANALVLPLVGVAVWSGALVAVFTPVAPIAATVLAAPGGWAAGATLAVAEWADARSLAVVGPAGAGAVLLGVLLVAVVRPPRWVTGATVACGLAVLVWWAPGPPGEPRMLVLDIGQGNATLLQDGEEGVLVDAGPVDGGTVAAIRQSGVRRLRAVVLSHPAADHDGGAAAVLEAFPTDLVLDGGEPGGGPTHDAAIRVARRQGVRVAAVRAGQRLAFGKIALRVRWPTPRSAAQSGDPNDRAAVIEAQVGPLRALLPADAEGAVLTKIPNLSAAVLVVSHHGSTDDHLPQVLGALRPQLAVISVGARNSYGHPTSETVGALRAARTAMLRTDESGTVDVRADAAGRVLVRRERR